MAAPKTFALVALVCLAVSTAAHADGMNLTINVDSLQAFAGTGQFLGSSTSNSGGSSSNTNGDTGSGATSAPAPQAPPAAPAPAPPVPAPAPSPPVSAPAAATPAGTTGPAAAYINFGTSPYAEQSNLTDGNTQSWTQSPVVAAAFGHAPSSAEQTAFRQAVLQDVDQTYQKSLANAGLAAPNFFVTDNPNVKAAHMMSVASGVTAQGTPQAIGLTDVGTNGFSFIDQFKPALNAGSGTAVTNLEWAVAHNISHELMHAFGIGYHPDQTGNYLDAPSANWTQLASPGFLLSPAALKAILAQNAVYTNVDGSSTYGAERARELVTTDPTTTAMTPEPATILLWVAAGSIVAARKARRRAA